MSPAKGAFALFLDCLACWLPGRVGQEAIATARTIVVRIAENERGGWSIYAASEPARVLFGGDEPTGNFGTYADAYKRAVRDNCWTVLDAR